MTRDEHIEKGRASLIPECCIQWWVDHDCNDYSREQASARCNYVPCPECERHATIDRADAATLIANFGLHSEPIIAGAITDE